MLIGAQPGTYTVRLTINSPALPAPLVLQRDLHDERGGQRGRQGDLQPS